MKDNVLKASEGSFAPERVIEKAVLGSRRLSNYLIGGMVTIGGIGFLLASVSSYLGRNFLPLGNPSSLIFVPQGLIMGLYGIAAFLLASYLWTLIAIDFGSGKNLFDKDSGNLIVSRRGLLKEIMVQIPLNEIKAVKLEVREGINPKRRISLRLKGRKDIPLTGVGQPMPLNDLEQEGAELARFLDVSLEGIS
tara:strand:- start:20603 stop:21181 length:579 start_codon:yes stop_codon:yes gene_type:complete